MTDPRSDPTQPPTRPTELADEAAATRPPLDPADPASAPTLKPARRGIATSAPGTTPPRWGEYEFIRELGRGGMGVVYEAVQVGLDRRVAVKVMLGASAELRRRFEREARALAQIDSPHVIKVLHAGERDGDLYFAMEYVEGQDLARKLASGWRPPHPESLALIRQAAAGLAAAAIKGLIHRDIKPANLMLAVDGTLKLMDFGLVRAADQHGSLTSTGMIMGTVNYFSPEQGMGQPCDARSDIYSLGVAFYELLTGRVPFRGETAAALIYQHVHTPPPPPRRYDPSIPEAYERVVLRCLAKKPEQRYQDAQALIDDLDRLREGADPAAPAIGPRRPRRITVMAGVLLILLAGTAAILAWRGQGEPAERKPAPIAVAKPPPHADPEPAARRDPTPPEGPTRPTPASAPDDQPLDPRHAAVLAAGEADAVAAELDAMLADGSFRADLPDVVAALRRGAIPADFALRRAAAAGTRTPELVGLALEQFADDPRLDLAGLVIRAGDDDQRLQVMRRLGKAGKPVPELRDDLLRLLETRPVHAQDELPQGEESLISAAVVLLATDLPAALAGRVARLANGTTYGYQALLQHAEPTGVPAVLDVMIATGRFRRDHYGMDEALHRGAVPTDFVPTRFKAANDEVRRELLKLAGSQLEEHGNETAHCFLWEVVFSTYSTELRSDAFSAQLNANRARGLPLQEHGELKLQAASLRRFFAAPANFWPRFADALADPAYREGMLRDPTDELLRSAGDDIGALLSEDPVAAARVIAGAGTVLEECEPVAWAAATFLAHVARDPTWRPTVDALIARWRAAGVREQEVDWLARNRDPP